MSNSPAGKFFGGLLIAAGVLITGLSGLCSATVLVAGIGGVLRGPSVVSNLMMGLTVVAIFGGLPFLLGIALVMGGRGLMKPSAAPRPVPPPSYGQDQPDEPPRADL